MDCLTKINVQPRLTPCRVALLRCAIALLSVTLVRQICHAESSRPNIVIVMSDDMGFSDIGCYGGEIETPNLDRLAANGLRFSQFYNMARCCPTRASLLTGLYPHQAGVGHMIEDKGLDGYRGELNQKCVTIAEALRPAGYRNYAVGKWHVCLNVQPNGDSHNWPLQRGFDRYYGTLTGAGSFFDPGTLTRDNTAISPFADPEYQPKQYYYTDAIADHASRFVREHTRDHNGSPFFMYVAFTAAHWPMHALPEDIAKYRGRYDRGYESIRQARWEKTKLLGLGSSNWTLSKSFGDWDKVEHREWEIRCMEVYAAMVDRMDQGIGRIVTALKDSGQLDNTLFLFLQDNGGCAENVGRSENVARPPQPTLPEIAATQLRQDVIPKQNRSGVPTLKGTKHLPGAEDTYIAYGEAWANVSNTPFRLYKHFMHEGGISSPLIVHWPDRIASARRNRIESTPAHLIDLMATCVDVANAQYPTERNSVPVVPLDGISLAPLLDGRKVDRGRPIFWEHEGNRAVRDGNWKLVARGPSGPWQLYDVEADRTEMRNLASEQPEMVKRMAATWREWAVASHVLPWPWKDGSNDK